MGTKHESIDLQSQIKLLVAELGWSQNKLARILYTELNEWDDESEIVKFQEKIKKDLQRPTTKIERLKLYLDVIVRHPEAQKLDLVFNRYIPKNSISPNLLKGMQLVSQELDKIYDATLKPRKR